MFTKKVLLLVSFLFALLIPALGVQAYDTPRIYVKEINLNQASFNGGDTISGDFLMWNTTEGIAADLDYKISLIKDRQVFGEQIFPVSEQIYPDKTYKQNFTYAVPANISSGKYIMMIRIYTNSDMPSNWGEKEITISGNDKMLVITIPKLMQGDKEFEPTVGVNFDPTEDPPKAIFKANNPSDKSIEYDLKATVYAVQSNMEEKESFSAKKGALDSKRSKDFSVTLPKYDIPGTYLAKIAFYENNILVSNEESFRWVIKGESARVLKVESNQDFFEKDKPANITVDLVGPADNSNIESANVTVSILAKDGTVLAYSSRDIKLGEGISSEVFEFTPSADVLSPTINVKITKDGKELDNYSAQIKSPGDKDNSAKPVVPPKKDSIFSKLLIPILITLIILLIIILIAKFIKNKKILMFLLLALPLAGSIVYFGAKIGQKIGISFVDAARYNDLAVSWLFPSKDTVYNFGGAIIFKGNVFLGACMNHLIYLDVSSSICDKDKKKCIDTPDDFTSVIPNSVAVAKEGAINYYYIADNGGRILKYNADTKAYVRSYGEMGSGNYKFSMPYSIFYSSPYLYVADTENNRIVRFNPTAADWTTTWKTYGSFEDVGGGLGEGKFNYPNGLFYDKNSESGGIAGTGYIYVADTYNHRIVRFKLNSAGNYVAGSWRKFGTGLAGYAAGEFDSPFGVFYDFNEGYVYVAGGYEDRVIRFKPGNVNGTWQKIGADKVEGFHFNDHGSGYTVPPTITITGGGVLPGNDATAHAVLVGGAVDEIIIDNPGSGYTSYPNVSFTGGGGGSGLDAWPAFGSDDDFGDTPGVFESPKSIYYDFASGYVYVAHGLAVVRFKPSDDMINGNNRRASGYVFSTWEKLGGSGTGVGNFYWPSITYDSGYVYAADLANYRIARFDPNNINTTNAGWDELDFTDPVASNEIFPYKIDTLVPAKAIFDAKAGFTFGPGGQAWAKVIIKARDDEGTYYEVESFESIFISAPPPPVPCPGIPTVTYSGQTYNTVQVGTQCWLKENLNVGTMINSCSGGVINLSGIPCNFFVPPKTPVNQANNPPIEKYCYKDNTANCDTYGGLYQWDEAMGYSTTEGAQGICPAGWHIPKDSEWFVLEDYLKDTSPLSCVSSRDEEPLLDCGTAGKKLKKDAIYGGNNSSGFSALLAGSRDVDGQFYDLNYDTHFWSSKENSDPLNAWMRSLWDGEDGIGRANRLKSRAMSVRCIKDAAPVVSDLDVFAPDYCEMSSGIQNSPNRIKFMWIFTDAEDGNSQTGYKMDLERDGGGIGNTCSTGYVSDITSSPSVLASNINGAGTCPADFISYGHDNYKWSITVRDSDGEDSVTVSSDSEGLIPFKTPDHQYPLAKFDYDPMPPPNILQFQSVNFDPSLSQAFGGFSIARWRWNFGDAKPFREINYNPPLILTGDTTYFYTEATTYTVDLEVTDNSPDTYSCWASEQGNTKDILIDPNKPTWTEVEP
jgi:uncharacterized protein (TIGR02145 family)